MKKCQRPRESNLCPKNSPLSGSFKGWTVSWSQPQQSNFSQREDNLKTEWKSENNSSSCKVHRGNLTEQLHKIQPDLHWLHMISKRLVFSWDSMKITLQMFSHVLQKHYLSLKWSIITLEVPGGVSECIWCLSLYGSSQKRPCVGLNLFELNTTSKHLKSTLTKRTLINDGIFILCRCYFGPPIWWFFNSNYVKVTACEVLILHPITHNAPVHVIQISK